MGNRASLPVPVASLSPPPPPPSPPAFFRCVDPALAAAVRRGWPAELGPWPPASALPFVYRPEYNITFFGIEKLHPFDSCKYKRVVQLLEAAGVVPAAAALTPAPEASLDLLATIHTREYLEKLERSPLKVAMVTELAPLALLPAAALRRKVLRPMRLMAGGSILAGALALERGWAVNLGGGMHHAHVADGGGWCAYDDISLMLRVLWAASGAGGDPAFRRAMVVDVDVHQGNGHERTKLHFLSGSGNGQSSGSGSCMPSVFTVDVYRGDIYPRDDAAKAGIDVDVPLPGGTADGAYLAALSSALEEAFTRCVPPPQLLVYNAGTDVLAGDPLGGLGLTPEGVVARDEAVFTAAASRGVPVVMLTSGGYTDASAPCIARSIENLARRFGVG